MPLRKNKSMTLIWLWSDFLCRGCHKQPRPPIGVWGVKLNHVRMQSGAERSLSCCMFARLALRKRVSALISGIYDAGLVCSFPLLSQINPGKQRRPLPLPLVPERSPWLKMIQMGAYKNKRIYKKLQKSKKLAVFQPRHNKKPFHSSWNVPRNATKLTTCAQYLISFDKTNTSTKPLIVSALLSKDFRSQCQPANPEKNSDVVSFRFLAGSLLAGVCFFFDSDSVNRCSPSLSWNTSRVPSERNKWKQTFSLFIWLGDTEIEHVYKKKKKKNPCPARNGSIQWLLPCLTGTRSASQSSGAWLHFNPLCP